MWCAETAAGTTAAKLSTSTDRHVPAETHTHHAPLDRDAVMEIVRDRLAEILEIDPGQISGTDALVTGLHADSIALYELVEALSEEFGERTLGLDSEPDELEDLQSVNDVVDYVVARIA